MSTLWHDAFYRFVKIDDPAQLSRQLKELCEGAAVLGSILVAEEGINGMLAGKEAQLEQIRNWFEADLRFQNLQYKRTPCDTQPFAKLKIRRKREIVPLGIAGVDAGVQTGIDVSPEAWRELIAQEDVVLIDNRNDFEVQLGRFRGALNPEVKHFRDFPSYIEAKLPEWQGKRLAMYCTGGIRCEKTTAWLKAEKGLDVYQLEGGILNYFEKVAAPEREFEGECFVFDNRIALDTDLNETTTTLEDVYDAAEDGWRLERASYLAQGPAGLQLSDYHKSGGNMPGPESTPEPAVPPLDDPSKTPVPETPDENPAADIKLPDNTDRDVTEEPPSSLPTDDHQSGRKDENITDNEDSINDDYGRT